jgi:hypothetical protein
MAELTDTNGIREIVREKYAAAAKAVTTGPAGASGSGSGCCCSGGVSCSPPDESGPRRSGST